MYGQVENGKVIKILNSKPEWRYDDETLISDADLLKENIYPVDTTFKRAVNFAKENLVVNNLKNMTVDYKSKKITNYFVAIPISVEEVYENKKRALELQKNEKMYTNLPYEFPNNKMGIIQLRNENDVNAINALYADAMFSITNSIDKTYYFKDESNYSHKMTSQQMSELGSFVKSHTDKVFLKHWDIKHNKLDTIFNSSASQSKRIDDMLLIDW